MAQKYTEARKAGNRKWDAANLDRISIAAPKGTKERWKTAATAQEKSLNQFIVDTIDAQMGKPPTSPVEAPTMHDGAGIVSLPSDTLKAAQDAAKAAGEGVPQFLDRAVTTQAQRDEMARKLGGAQ